MSTSNVQKLWQQHWKTKTTIEESGFFYSKLLHQKHLVLLQNILSQLNPTSTVLDMGCGGGSTITTFKKCGFTNIKGIDFTTESIHRCQEKGLKLNVDIFLMDASHTSFPSNSFDIIFSEGLWEHFTDPRPHMAEAARLAKIYVIIIQPDHFSLFGFLMHLGWNLFSKNKGGVCEYSFPLSYFQNFLKMYNFDLISSKSTPLHEQTIMVFKKNSKWLAAQQHELNYTIQQEPKTWKMHSADFWTNQLHLTTADIKGQGIEIGCGNNGIYNYLPNIIGLDTINFPYKSNFIHATGEHLPIKQIDYAILCNSLDHCSNPEQVLNEISHITSTLVFWTYIYPKLVSFLLSKLDKMHPYHFTKTELKHLLTNFTETSKIPYSPLKHWKYAGTKIAKIKLLIMYLLNIKGICLHLQQKPTYSYNIHGLRIGMYIKNPYSKLAPFLVPKIKNYDLTFHINSFTQSNNNNSIYAEYKHKLSHWKIQLKNFNKEQTTVHFQGDPFFSRHLFFTMIFEPLLQYKHSKRNNLTLHASAVSNGGKAYAFSGDANIGKTTLLLYFLSKGFHYLADDQTMIDIKNFKVLPYALPIGVSLKLALKTKLILTKKEKLSLLFQTFINTLFLDYTNLTTNISLQNLKFNNNPTILGKPTKIHKVFVLKNSDALSISKLTPQQAFSELWNCKFGSKSKLPALIYYAEEFKKKDPTFSLWNDYCNLLSKLVKEIPIYQILFNKKQFPEAIKLIEKEIQGD